MTKSIDKRERIYQAFGSFLVDFIHDLNNSSEEGWCVLVEGQRDQAALRKLGYTGHLVTVSTLRKKGVGALAGCTGTILLTDLDREGTVLASRFARELVHESVKVSLRERLRLRVESRGVFLHVENLGRFAVSEGRIGDLSNLPRQRSKSAPAGRN